MNCPLCDTKLGDFHTHDESTWQYCSQCRSIYSSDYEYDLPPYFVEDHQAVFNAPLLAGRGYSALIAYLNANPKCDAILSESGVYNYATAQGMEFIARDSDKITFTLPTVITKNINQKIASDESTEGDIV